MATRRKSLKNPTPVNRAVVYIRVSTDKQVESGLGLGDQRERLESYCGLRGLEIVEVVVDDGESGGKPMASRPGGRRVLELVGSRKVDTVVVLKLDRAFRNAKDCLNVVDDWAKADVALHIVDMGGESLNTRGAMSRMFLTMAAAFAEMERGLIMERTTAALAHKARSGNMRTNRNPEYGFAYGGPEGNDYVEVPGEQHVLEAVRTLKAQGLSVWHICKQINALGYRNRAGTEFKRTQIERMLLGSVRQMYAAET